MLLAALLLLAAAPPGEDAAHRNDRLHTQALNRRAAKAAGAARPTDRDTADWQAAQADYRAAQADYARDLARWRRQVADCRAGDHDACRPR